MDHLFLSIVRLGKAAQKHCHSGDVLASSSELWGIVPLVHDVALDLVGVTLGAAHRVPRVGHNVLHRVCRRRWRLVLLSLS